MIRVATVPLAAWITLIMNTAWGETLTIFNTAQHPVVIGVYEHSPSGIRERLIPVKSMSETRNIPIEINGNECFAVAYLAEVHNDDFSRSTPITICGMRKLPILDRKKKPDRDSEIILQYRARGLFPEQDSFGTNLYTGRGRGEEIKKSIAHSYGGKIERIDFATLKKPDDRTKP